MGKKKNKNKNKAEPATDASAVPNISTASSSIPPAIKVPPRDECGLELFPEYISHDTYQEVLKMCEFLAKTMTEVTRLTKREKEGIELTEEDELVRANNRHLFAVTGSAMMKTTGWTVPKIAETMSKYCVHRGHQNPQYLSDIPSLYAGMQDDLNQPDPFVDARLEGDELLDMWERTQRLKVSAGMNRRRKECQALLTQWIEDFGKADADANAIKTDTAKPESIVVSLRSRANEIMEKYGRRNLADTKWTEPLPLLFIAFDNNLFEYYCRPWGVFLGLGDIKIANQFRDTQNREMAMIGESIWRRELGVLINGIRQHKRCQGNTKTGAESNQEACNECIEANRICWEFESGKCTMLPVPKHLRSTEDAREMGYWVRDPDTMKSCCDPITVQEEDWESVFESDGSDASVDYKSLKELSLLDKESHHNQGG